MPTELGSAYGKIEIGTEGAEQSVKSLSDSLKGAGTAMSLAVTTPLVGIATAAVMSAGEFEQSLNVMQQISGATADQMQTLQAQALEMGAVTSFSAGEAAQAQLELVKAGLSVNEVMAATPGVLDMAAAGGMGMAESAEIAANALNAFNLPASEMPNIANMLAAAANASSVDIGDLAAAMKMSGAVFASNKQPMDDMVTALAMLGNAGLKGSDAGTSLKTMMLSLAAPTDKAYAVMQDLGLAVYGADGSMRGFSDILNDLANTTRGMSDEQRNLALSTIFGSDAIRAASILTRDYGESWDGISDALGEGGAAAAVAGARMKGMSGAIEYFKGSVDSFLIGQALPFLDSLSGIVVQSADALTAIGALPEPVRNTALAFAAVLAAAGPVMLALSGIGAAIAFLLSPLGLVVVGVAAVAAGWVAWSQNLGGIQQRVAAFANTIKGMAKSMLGIDFDAIAGGVQSFGSYIGAVVEDGDYLNDWLTHLPEAAQPAAESFGRFVAAVSDLWKTGDIGAFGQEMRDMFPQAAEAVDGAVERISTAFAEISDAITSFREGYLDVPELIWSIANALMGGGADYYVIRDAVNAIGSAWDSVRGTALAIWAWLQLALPAAINGLKEVWSTAWPAMWAALQQAWSQISNALGAAWGWLQVALPAAIDWLRNAWAQAWPAMQASMQSAWTSISGALGAAWAWLQVSLPAAVNWLKEAWNTAWPAMWTALQTAWGQISGALAGAWAWLQVALPAAVSGLQSLWTQAWPAIQSALQTAWGIIGPALAQAWGWLQVALPVAIGALQTAWDTAWPTIQTALSTAWAVIGPALAQAWAWVQVALPVAIGTLQNIWNTAWPAIQSALQTAWGVIGPALAAAWGWLQVALPVAVGALQTAWNTAWPAIQTALTTAWDAIRPIFDAIGAFFSGAPEKLTAVQTQFGTLGDKLSTIGTTLQTAFAPGIERVQTAFAALPEKLAPLQPKLDALVGAFGGLVQAVQPLIMLVGAALGVAAMFGVNLFASVIDRLPGIVGPIIDQVTASIQTITTIINEVVAGVKAAINGDWAGVWQSARTILAVQVNFMRGTFFRMSSALGEIIKAVYDAVVNTLKDLGVDITPLLDGIKSTWDSVWTKVKDALQPVVDAVGNVKTAIEGFSTWLAGITLPNPFQPLVDAWNSIKGQFPGGGSTGGGGVDGDPSTPEAMGTSYFAGGRAQINERGYEEIALPAGSRVYTNGQTNNLPRQTVTNVNVNMSGVQIKSDLDIHIVGRQLGSLIAAQMGA